MDRQALQTAGRARERDVAHGGHAHAMSRGARRMRNGAVVTVAICAALAHCCVDALVAQSLQDSPATAEAALAIGNGTTASAVVYAQGDELLLSLSIVLVPTAACANVTGNDSLTMVAIKRNSQSADDDIWWTFCASQNDGNATRCESVSAEVYSTQLTYTGVRTDQFGTPDEMLGALFGAPSQFYLLIDSECAMALNGNATLGLMRANLMYGLLFAASSIPESRLLAAPQLSAASARDSNVSIAANATYVGSSSGRVVFGSPRVGELNAVVSLSIEQTDACAEVLGFNYTEFAETGQPVPVVSAVDLLAWDGEETALNSAMTMWWRLCGEGASPCAPLMNATTTTTYAAVAQEVQGLSPEQMLTELYSNPERFSVYVYTDCSQAIDRNSSGKGLIQSPVELLLDPVLLRSTQDLAQIERSQPSGMVSLSLAGENSYATATLSVSESGALELDPAWSLNFENSACNSLGVDSGEPRSIEIRRGGLNGTPVWGFCGTRGTQACPESLDVSDDIRELAPLSEQASVSDLFRRPHLYVMVVNTACQDLTARVLRDAAPVVFASTLLVQRYYFVTDVAPSDNSDSDLTQAIAQIRVAPSRAIAMVIDYALVDSEFRLDGIACDAGFDKLAIAVDGGDSVVVCESVNGSSSEACPNSNRMRVQYVVTTESATQSAVFRDLSRGAGNPQLVFSRVCTWADNNTAIENTTLMGPMQRLSTLSVSELAPNPVTDPDVLSDASGNSSARTSTVLDAGNRALAPLAFALQDNTTGCFRLGEPSQRMVTFSLNVGSRSERGDALWTFCAAEPTVNTTACPDGNEGNVLFRGSPTSLAEEEASGRASMSDITLNILLQPMLYYVQLSTECSEAFRSGSSLLRAQLGGTSMASPTPFPPNNSPTLPPQPTASPTPDGNPCFPGDATVELESGARREMRDLKIGDRVRVVTANCGSGCESDFSDVFFFGHRAPSQSAEYISLRIQRGDDLTIKSSKQSTRFLQLQLSGDHFLYANGMLVAADQIAIGDTVDVVCEEGADEPDICNNPGVHCEDGCLGRVVHLSLVRKDGLYSPHTLHGDIVVDSVRASSYTRLVPVIVTKTLLLPLRMLYQCGARSAFGLMRFLDDGAPRLAHFARRYLMPLSAA